MDNLRENVYSLPSMFTFQELINKVQEFAAEIGSDLLCQAFHQPEKKARPSCCFQNVWDKVDRDDGNILYGWTFNLRINAEYGEYLMATHHAVWCAPDNKLIDVTPFTDDQLSNLDGRLLLDVRGVDEFESGHSLGAVNIPLPQLRDRLNELKPEQEIWVYCQVGQRAYYATRILRLNGFKAYNLSGGFKTSQAFS